MYDALMLLFAGIAAVGATLAGLEVLGFDLRLKRDPILVYQPLEQQRNKKGLFTLLLATATLLMAFFAFYFFFRPRVEERTVEKVVEKPVRVPNLRPLPLRRLPTQLHERPDLTVRLTPYTHLERLRRNPLRPYKTVQTGFATEAITTELKR